MSFSSVWNRHQSPPTFLTWNRWRDILKVTGRLFFLRVHSSNNMWKHWSIDGLEQDGDDDFWVNRFFLVHCKTNEYACPGTILKDYTVACFFNSTGNAAGCFPGWAQVQDVTERPEYSLRWQQFSCKRYTVCKCFCYLPWQSIRYHTEYTFFL